MSYDLHLKPRLGEFSPRDFLASFEGRPRYTLNGTQAWYENPDTGVTFSFEVNSDDDEVEDDDPAGSYPVSFNMNLFRPSFFVLEAELELTRVVRQFDFEVFDPQFDVKKGAAYEPSRFVAQWQRANTSATAAHLEEYKDTPVRTLPAATLKRIWRWNYHRGALQSKLGDSVFVPSIMFFAGSDVVNTVVVWADCIPCVFPTFVDRVVVYLQQMAPWRLFGRKPTLAQVDWSRLAPILGPHGRLDGDTFRVDYEEAPPDVVAFARSLKPSATDPVGIQPALVLDAEIVARVRGG